MILDSIIRQAILAQITLFTQLKHFDLPLSRRSRIVLLCFVYNPLITLGPGLFMN